MSQGAVFPLDAGRADCRPVALVIVEVFRCPIFFGLDGLLRSFPAADLLTFVITVFFIRQTYRELSEPSSTVLGTPFSDYRS